MADNGFIKLYRSCRNNPFWKDKPFTKWQAFEDLILCAAYEPTEVYLKGQVVSLERGQLIKGVSTLANDWGWSTKKTRTYLNTLKIQKMATFEGTSTGTLITIVNYSTYQGEGQAKGTANGQTKGNQRASEGRAKGNKERNKEVKERKEDKETKNIYAELPPALLSALLDFEEMRKKKRNPMTDRARELLIKKLQTLSGGDVQKCIALLEESIEKGWASVYPPKQEQAKKKMTNFMDLDLSEVKYDA